MALDFGFWVLQARAPSRYDSFIILSSGRVSGFASLLTCIAPYGYSYATTSTYVFGVPGPRRQFCARNKAARKTLGTGPCSYRHVDVSLCQHSRVCFIVGSPVTHSYFTAAPPADHGSTPNPPVCCCAPATSCKFTYFSSPRLAWKATDRTENQLFGPSTADMHLETSRWKRPVALPIPGLVQATVPPANPSCVW
jgi:hypothetical protein